MARTGVFPGSFDPLTVAHLAIADAAVVECGLDVLDLVVSATPLAKEDRRQAPVADRLAAIEARAATRPWLGARQTSAQLLADIAAGYDVLVMGADKWHQLHDDRFYGSVAARDEALASLPEVVVVLRPGHGVPAGGATIVELPVHLRAVSSTGVREGRSEWRA